VVLFGLQQLRKSFLVPDGVAKTTPRKLDLLRGDFDESQEFFA
jgi:hypothetical protein